MWANGSDFPGFGENPGVWVYCCLFNSYVQTYTELNPHRNRTFGLPKFWFFRQPITTQVPKCIFVEYFNWQFIGCWIFRANSQRAKMSSDSPWPYIRPLSSFLPHRPQSNNQPDLAVKLPCAFRSVQSSGKMLWGAAAPMITAHSSTCAARARGAPALPTTDSNVGQRGTWRRALATAAQSSMLSGSKFAPI